MKRYLLDIFLKDREIIGVYPQGTGLAAIPDIPLAPWEGAPYTRKLEGDCARQYYDEDSQVLGQRPPILPCSPPPLPRKRGISRIAATPVLCGTISKYTAKK